MKINPVAIQTYQQTTLREKPTAHQAEDPQAQAAARTTIAPQNEGTDARMAVKPSSGNYADFLTTEEKSALDLLFSKFKDSAKFGPGYSRDAGNDTESNLGQVIDVKV